MLRKTRDLVLGPVVRIIRTSAFSGLEFENLQAQAALHAIKFDAARLDIPVPSEPLITLGIGLVMGGIGRELGGGIKGVSGRGAFIGGTVLGMKRESFRSGALGSHRLDGGG
jgi:hypothetical protein